MGIRGQTFFVGDWRVSPAEGRLARGEESLRLEPKTMEVLVYLASRPGEVISREELERDVWHGALVGYDAVTGTVIKLRKALGDNAREPRCIVTVPKRGYQLIAPVGFPDAADSSSQSSDAIRAPPAAGRAARKPPWRRRVPIALALAGALVLGLLGLWSRMASPPDAPAGAGLASPSIVVLPFQNLSDDPAQEYLADGMTEDLITDLSRSSGLLVIASNTAFSYKAREVSPEQVGKDLDVDFVLQGSIRPLGDAVRINARLVDARTGFNKWAQRYDRTLGEIFTVQDEIRARIIKALAVSLTSREKQRIARKSTLNLQAYDFFHEGQALFKIYTKETNVQAREAYRQAIEADPTYGRAYGALGFTLAVDFRRGWTDSPVETLDRALELTRQGVALNDSIPQTYWSLGYVHLMRKEYDDAERVVEKAIGIAPNYADGYGLLALISNNLGKPEQALSHVTKGMRLNPYYTWDYPFNLGWAHYMLGHYEEAIAALETAHERNPNVIPIKLVLAASYVQAGRLEDAEWLIQEVQMLNPAETIAQTENAMPVAKPALMQAFLADLRKAGLPE